MLWPNLGMTTQYSGKSAMHFLLSIQCELPKAIGVKSAVKKAHLNKFKYTTGSSCAGDAKFGTNCIPAWSLRTLEDFEQVMFYELP